MLRAMLGAAAVLFVVGCNNDANLTDAEYVSRAKEYQGEGDLKAGVIQLKNALQKNSNNAEARWLLSKLYVDMGIGDAAEKELIRAKELGVSEVAIQPVLGEALLLQKKYRQVLTQVVESGNFASRDFATILRIRGEAQLGLGDVEAGCALFLRAKEAVSDYAPAHLGLAKCAASRKELDIARKHIEKAIELDPNYSDSWLILSRLEAVQGNTKAAEKALRKAVELNRYNIIALLEHANTVLALNDLESFKKDSAEFKKLHPSHYLNSYLIALLDIREGRPDAARDNLIKVVAQNPEHLQAQLLLGSVNLDLKTFSTAESILGAVVAKAPGSPLARRLLARAQLKVGAPERVLETLQPLLSVDKPDVGDLTLAGEAYMRSGDFNKAKQFFTLAQASKPESSITQVNVARASLAEGELDQALRNLEVAIKLDPVETNADTMLVLTQLTAGDYVAAIQTAQRLIDKSPDEVFAHHLKGAAYLGKKDLVAARQAFTRAVAIEPTFTLSLLKLADIDILENKPQDAKRRLDDAVKKNRNDGRLMMALARLEQQQGNQQLARSWVEQVVKANPKALEPRESLIQLLVLENKTEQALLVAREAVQSNPGSPLALNLLGIAQMAANDRAAALTTYQQIIKMYPKNAGGHYRLGLTLMALGRNDEARKSLTTALSLAPDIIEVPATLATLEIQIGRFTQAIKIARDIQRSSPEYHAGYMLEGDALFGQGKTVEATKFYEAAFAKAKTGAVLIRLTRALAAIGRGSEAEGRLLDWLKTQSQDRDVRLQLAGYYETQGQLKNAIIQYEILAGQFPEDVVILNNLATLYQKTGDARALETAERAFKRQPEHPATLDTLGWILVQQRQVKRGLELLDKAITKAPKNRELRYHHASALVAAGEKEKAKKELLALLVSGPFAQKNEAQALLDKL